MTESAAWGIIALLALTCFTLLRELRLDRKEVGGKLDRVLERLTGIEVTLARMDERLKTVEGRS